MMIYTPEKGIHEIKETTIEIDYTPSELKSDSIFKVTYEGGIYKQVKPKKTVSVIWRRYE